MVFLRKGSVYEKIIPTQKKNSAGSWRGIQSRKASKRCTENVHFKVVTYEDEHNYEHCSAHVFDTCSLPRRIFRRDSMLCITACLHHRIAHCTAHSNIARKNRVTASWNPSSDSAGQGKPVRAVE